MSDGGGETGGSRISYTQRESRQPTPLGIKIFCVIAGLANAHLMVVSMEVIGTKVLLGWLLFVLSAGGFVVLLGLWMVESWAWTGGMILIGVSLGMDVGQADLFGAFFSMHLLGYLASKHSVYRDRTADSTTDDGAPGWNPGTAEGDITNPLEDIAGVGAQEADALREGGFESIADVQAASLGDLTAVEGIGTALAARIKADVEEHTAEGSDATSGNAEQHPRKE